MGGRCAEGQITDPRNTKMDETTIREKRIKASFDGRQCPKGDVAS